MKSRTPLQQAAFCALADLVGLYNDDSIIDNEPVFKTMRELYEVLQSEGHDVSAYNKTYKAICENLEELYQERLKRENPRFGS